MAEITSPDAIKKVIVELRGKLPRHADKQDKSTWMEPYLVTPYLPPEAEAAKKNHEFFKRPVFIRSLSHNPRTLNYCPNCGGSGYVYITLIDKGPFQHVPTTSSPITWFDGDGQYGKGWYVVEKTMGFACPECKKRG